MMLVPTYLDKSPIHGIGIFASGFIPRGTPVWEFTPDADQVFDASDLDRLLPLQRETILFYGYIEPGCEGVVLCCDNARHFNLLQGANCGSGDQSAHGYVSTLALRDIAAGEELTYPFEEDMDARRKLGDTEFLRQTGLRPVGAASHFLGTARGGDIEGRRVQITQRPSGHQQRIPSGMMLNVR